MKESFLEIKVTETEDKFKVTTSADISPVTLVSVLDAVFDKNPELYTTMMLAVVVHAHKIDDIDAIFSAMSLSEED